jgi:pimeloyl-ACP methyl ester carboxylesterase
MRDMQSVCGASRRWRVAALVVVAMGLVACGAADESSAPGGGGAGGKLALEIPCDQQADARLQEMSDAGIGLASLLGLASGRYALPANPAPSQLVVMFHGHGNDSCSWRRHLQSVADKGAVAVAMDYSGQLQEPIPHYGWRARAGAADSIAAARYFLDRYPSIKTVHAFAVSMGGNVAGVALAAPEAVRADGSPLFDDWVAVEGVHNLTEEYLVVRTVAPAVPDGAIAQAEIEAENGGPIEAVPNNYLEITNVARAADYAYLKSVVLVHAVDDGLVPTTQSREMFLALSGQSVTSHLYTVLLRGDAEDGSTASGLVLGPVYGAGGQVYTSALAGHGWEGSDTQLVIRTGLDQLYALMDGAEVTVGETVIPGL